MKTKILAITLLSSLLLSTHAQDSVYSNVVGMVKMTAPKGQFAYVSSNFIFAEGPVTVSSFFGDTLPSSTAVYFWVIGADGGYESAIYGSRGWSNGDIEIDRAKGFIVSIPDSASEDAYDIVLSGHVPMSAEEPSTTLTINSGFTLFGLPYAVPTLLSEAGFTPQSQDRVHIWNGTQWVTSTFGSRGGWSEDLTIEPGMAFFYESTDLNNRDWVAQNPVTE